MSSKFKKWRAAVAAIAAMFLIAFGFTAIGVSAASAEETPTVGVYLTPFVDEITNIPTVEIGLKPLSDETAAVKVYVDSTNTEPIVDVTFTDGAGISVTYYEPPQCGDTTFVVTLNGEVYGTYPVTVPCVEQPVAPSVTGPLTSDTPSVVNYDLVFDQGTSTEGPWTISIDGPRGTAKIITVQGSGPVKGSFPYACGEATFYVSVSGQDGYSSPQDVSVPCPVEKAPSVSATFQGSLLEKVPTVGYAVNYDPGTFTGSQIVTIATLDGKILDLTFEGAGSLTGSFPLACGDHTLLTVLVNGEQRIESEPQSVTVPCAVDNGGNTGGTDGGNSDGGTTTPPTGGTDGGTTTPVVDTTKEIPSTNVVNAGATGDRLVSPPLPLYAGGALLVAAAIVLIVRHKLVSGR